MDSTTRLATCVWNDPALAQVWGGVLPILLTRRRRRDTTAMRTFASQLAEANGLVEERSSSATAHTR